MRLHSHSGRTYGVRAGVAVVGADPIVDSSAHPGTRHCPWGAELASRTPLVERVRTWAGAVARAYARVTSTLGAAARACVHELSMLMFVIASARARSRAIANSKR